MLDVSQIDFSKSDGLVPAIIQDSNTQAVLMLGYMNKEAVEKTQADKVVTFYSRSKKRLWTKGESSGNFLKLVSIQLDCDSDSVLVGVIPTGNVCHKDTYSCFSAQEKLTQGQETSYDIIRKLELLIEQRRATASPTSYTNTMLAAGISAVSQKVGEEAVELVIEAVSKNIDRVKEEGADLIYHLLLQLNLLGLSWEDICGTLQQRFSQRGCHIR